VLASFNQRISKKAESEQIPQKSAPRLKFVLLAPESFYLIDTLLE